MPSPDADTDELLRRLRKHANGPIYISEPSRWQERRETLQQAAADIERLRAALAAEQKRRDPLIWHGRVRFKFEGDGGRFYVEGDGHLKEARKLLLQRFIDLFDDDMRLKSHALHPTTDETKHADGS